MDEDNSSRLINKINHNHNMEVFLEMTPIRKLTNGINKDPFRSNRYPSMSMCVCMNDLVADIFTPKQHTHMKRRRGFLYI